MDFFLECKLCPLHQFPTRFNACLKYVEEGNQLTSIVSNESKPFNGKGVGKLYEPLAEHIHQKWRRDTEATPHNCSSYIINTVNVPVATLPSNGKTIPLVGFGTAEYPFNSTGSVKGSVLHAIGLGYRHFDTAAIYLCEQPVGEAIAEALHLGLIKSRDELFITSKLWISNAHADLVVPALQTTLKNLGLEYLDLYLIHSPLSLRPGSDSSHLLKKEDIMKMDFESVWGAMEECQKLGLTKSIGVSNFSCKKLEELLAIAKIPPAVNQVELNPVWQQKKLRKFCEEKGIHITAYSPLGAKGTAWGTNRVMDSEVLQEIAKAKGKSVAQICLRWVYEQRVSVLVKSFNQERMRENLDIFNWRLSQEELDRIEQIPQSRGNTSEFAVSEQGPYKSIEEFWDGEI